MTQFYCFYKDNERSKRGKAPRRPPGQLQRQEPPPVPRARREAVADHAERRGDVRGPPDERLHRRTIIAIITIITINNDDSTNPNNHKHDNDTFTTNNNNTNTTNNTK